MGKHQIYFLVTKVAKFKLRKIYIVNIFYRINFQLPSQTISTKCDEGFLSPVPCETPAQLTDESDNIIIDNHLRCLSSHFSTCYEEN